MRNVGLDEAQPGIKVARRNISNLGYADDTILMAESKDQVFIHNEVSNSEKIPGITPLTPRGKLEEI